MITVVMCIQDDDETTEICYHISREFSISPEWSHVETLACSTGTHMAY